MVRLIERGFRAKKRPSGHLAKDTFQRDHGGAIPGNVLTLGNNDSNGRYIALLTERGIKVHPARFPVQLPEWFIRFLTDPDDLVVDIFGGSMTTGWAAERTGRQWIGMELEPEYVSASKFRFFDDDGLLLPDESTTATPLMPVVRSTATRSAIAEEVPIQAPREADFEDLSIRPAS
jgi:site-specific DNA-methyltransferase (cytosine-N4-specific)